MRDITKLSAILGAASEVAQRVATSFLEKQKAKSDHEMVILKQKQKLDTVKIKSPGNQKQFEYCREIMDKIDVADNFMDQRDIESAKEALAQGKKAILKRIKLIRIADREDWATVNEYISDDLASDSEDEKHLNKAIRSANSKCKKRRKHKLQKRNYHQNYPYTYNREAYPYSQQKLSHSNQRVQRFETKVCWGCGRYGHFQSRCMFNNSNRNQNLAVPHCKEERR